MMLRSVFVLLAVTVSPLCAQTLFSENWDDSLGSGRWSAPIEVQENAGVAFDGAVDYAFDYSTLGAPAAPNQTGGSTTGAFLETNTTDQTLGDEGEAIGILPLGFTLPDTDYQIRADMYLFMNGGGGSTEYATIGTHHQGSANTPMRFNLNNGDGIAWQVDTDGDSGTDLFRYEGPGGETGLGGWESITNGFIPGVPTGSAGTIGVFNQWVEMTITSTSGTVEFAVNSFVIDTYDNTGETFTGGTLLLGQSDPFNSVNVDNGSGLSNGVVFDNVLVTAISAPLVGDYNGNGTVDAADYTVWRDGNSPDSTIAGYNLWVNHFGESNAAAAVPEPTSVTLLALAFFACRKEIRIRRG